jgi:periplasmic protein TonB
MQSWEEIIYEDRNKRYGSYVLRKNQFKYLLIGLLGSIVLMLTPTLIIYFSYSNKEQDDEIPMTISVQLSPLPDMDKIEEQAPPPPKKDVVKNTDANVIPTISDSVKKNQAELIIKKIDEQTDSLLLAQKKNAVEGNGLDTENEKSVYINADEMPEFIGGNEEMMKFIRRNTIYPEVAIRKKISGKVIVQFTVTPFGDVRDVKLVSGVDPVLDKEAIRVVGTLPKMRPARVAGKKAISFKYTIPVTFHL